MKRYTIALIIFCFFLSSCVAQKTSTNFDQILEEVYKSQVDTYNNISGKENYKSIVNFGKQERLNVFKPIKSLLESDDFFILEGFKPAWGEFVGLIWNKKSAYSYRRSSKNRKLEIKKITLPNNDFRNFSDIDYFIIKKVIDWDVNYIHNLKNSIGMGVSDGYYFMATRVYLNNLDPNIKKVETIAFEQFKQ